MKNKSRKILTIFIVLAIVLTGMNYKVNAAEEGENQEDGTTQNTENTQNGQTQNTETNNSSDTTSDKNTTSNSQSSSSQTDESKKATTTQTKSNNANLKDLGIRPNDFSGFKASQTTYNVTVPNNVDAVEVYATAQDSNATLSGTGKKSLQEGANALMVTVTAQDGTKKTYTINVTREAAEENEEEAEVDEDVKEQAKGLQKIEIAGIALSPEFKTNVYEYTAKYIGEETEIKVDAVATDSDYIVEVTGNKNLQEGENIITILVSDAKGNNVATYQITLNKSLVDEEALAREQEEARQKQEKQRKMIAGGIAALLLIIAIIVFVIIRRRRNKILAEEYSVPFSGLNNDDYDENANQLEDFDQNMNYKPNQNIEETTEDEEEYESDIEQIEETDDTKAKIRAEFLKNYNLDDYEEVEKTKRRKSKGKRFK